MNVGVKLLLRIVSKFEKRETKTEEVISNTIKMFVTQLVNSAILLLIVNSNIGFIPSWFPFFGGDYNDFANTWYLDVGATILFMMLLSIFTPHFANFCFHLLNWAKRCYDRGCRNDPRRTRKVFQVDYETLYMGPVYLLEYRYSNMLTMIFIALIFG